MSLGDRGRILYLLAYYILKCEYLLVVILRKLSVIVFVHLEKYLSLQVVAQFLIAFDPTSPVGVVVGPLT